MTGPFFDLCLILFAGAKLRRPFLWQSPRITPGKQPASEGGCISGILNSVDLAFAPKLTLEEVQEEDDGMSFDFENEDSLTIRGDDASDMPAGNPNRFLWKCACYQISKQVSFRLFRADF